MAEIELIHVSKSWGNFKAHNINLSILGKNNTEAVKIFDKAGWE